MRVVILGVSLLAALAVGAPAPLRADTADTFRAAIWERISTRYKDVRLQKAMAGCVDWERSTMRRPVIHHALWYSTDPNSDGEIFVTRLMRSALNDCEELRAESGRDCECLAIAKNDGVVLEVPSERLARLEQPHRAPRKDLWAELRWNDRPGPHKGRVRMDEDRSGGSFTARGPGRERCEGRFDFEGEDEGVWQASCGDRQAQGRFEREPRGLRGVGEGSGQRIVGFEVLWR